MVAQAVTLWEVLWAEDYWNQMDTWTPADAQEEGQEQVQYGGPSARGSQAGQHSLLLYFIAALTLRHRRRIIDNCRDQASSSVLEEVCTLCSLRSALLPDATHQMCIAWPVASNLYLRLLPLQSPCRGVWALPCLLLQ